MKEGVRGLWWWGVAVAAILSGTDAGAQLPGASLWTNFYSAHYSIDEAMALAVDSGGNVFVTGRSWGGDSSGFDFATIKCSGGGVPLWTNRFNGSANTNDVARAIAVDNSGNAFVT